MTLVKQEILFLFPCAVIFFYGTKGSYFLEIMMVTGLVIDIRAILLLYCSISVCGKIPDLLPSIFFALCNYVIDCSRFAVLKL